MPGHSVDPAIFEKKDLEKYKCPKCALLLKDAVQPSCGHWLCLTCAETLFASESSPRCPKDDCGDDLTCEDGANYFPDRFVRREILGLDVVCQYSANGCNWTGKFLDFEAHLRTCGYAFAQCDHCHQNVAASEMEAHLSVCPKVARPCPLTSLGCKETGLVTDLKSHLSENLDSHFIMLAGKVTQLSDSVQKLESEKSAMPVQRTEADGGYSSLPNDPEADDKLMRPTPTEKSFQQMSFMYEDDLYKDGSGGRESSPKPKKVLETFVGPPNSDLRPRVYDDKLEQITLMMRKEIARVQDEVEGNFKSQLKRHGEEIGALRTANAKLEKMVRAKNAEIEDRDFRLSLIENSNHDGSMIWKIPQFSQRMSDAESGKYTSIFSLPFYTGRYGFKMCLRLYILGDGIGKNSHMSLFFVIMRGEFDNILQWPFTHKVTFKLLNQTGVRDVIDTFQPDPMSSSFKKPKSDMNVASGCPRFVSHQELKSGGFIIDDTIFIKCIIDRTALKNP